jgi:hypothetical protein
MGQLRSAGRKAAWYRILDAEYWLLDEFTAAAAAGRARRFYPVSSIPHRG